MRKWNQAMLAPARTSRIIFHKDHLPLEGGVEYVGGCAGDEHAEAGDGGDREGAPGPGDQFPGKVADRIAHGGEAEQAQVDEEDRADDHGDGDDVDRFDEREQPGAADLPAQRPVFDLDPEWVSQEIGKHRFALKPENRCIRRRRSSVPPWRP